MSSTWNQLLSALANMARPTTTAVPGLLQGPVTPGPPMSFWQHLFQNMGNERQGPAAQGPAATIGPLQTVEQHLLPEQYGWLGATRPLGPGEYVVLQGGERASEEDYTLPVDREGNAVKDGEEADHWRVIPGLWLVDGVPTHVSEDHATELGKRSGLSWPQYPSEEAANARYVNPREAKWESAPAGRTDLQPPIWQYHPRK